MLPKKLRLKKKKEFERVFRNGLSAAQGNLRLCFLKNELGFNRFAIATKKGTFSSNPAKNRAKRILSELIRLNLKKIKKSYDMIIIVKNVDNYLSTALAKILKKTGLLEAEI